MCSFKRNGSYDYFLNIILVIYEYIYIYIYDSLGKLKLLKLLPLLLFHTGMGSMSSKCVQPYLIAMDFVTLKVRFLNYKTDFVNGFAHIKFFF